MKTKKDNKQYDCADVEKNVQKYIDGQLSNDELVIFEDHLNNCLPCDKKVEFEKKLKELIKNKSKHETEILSEKLFDDLNKMINPENT